MTVRDARGTLQGRHRLHHGAEDADDHGRQGLVRRDDSERSHTYLAVDAEPVVQRSLVRPGAARVRGSAMTLVQRALDDDTSLRNSTRSRNSSRKPRRSGSADGWSRCCRGRSRRLATALLHLSW
jgi:hypothetical protein